ncbi:hypothetical protein GR247_37750 [Rhizobium leguminosarum]|nr:hypothetical protein [Rhizobium leguminosarum]
MTFVPNTCRIYGRTLRVISGFGCVCPLACGFHKVRDKDFRKSRTPISVSPGQRFH